MPRLEQLKKLHAATPDDPDVAYMLAHEHVKMGELAAALHWFDVCLGLDAGYHYAYFHKAKALAAAGEVEKARGVLEVGLQRATRDANAKASSEIAGLLQELEA